MSGKTTPILLLLSHLKHLAAVLGIYPSFSAASRTFSAVVFDIEVFPDKTRETVEVDTPAIFATSLLLLYAQIHLLNAIVCKFINYIIY